MHIKYFSETKKVFRISFELLHSLMFSDSLLIFNSDLFVIVALSSLKILQY